MITWVVPPASGADCTQQYGVVSTGTFQLSIYTACCEAPLISTAGGAHSKCEFCRSVIMVSKCGSYGYDLYWGAVSWDRVENVITEWLTYWFGFDQSDTKVHIDGRDPKENML